MSTEAKGSVKSDIKVDGKNLGECTNFIENQFDDTTEWVTKNPGNIEYSCEYCGIYDASKPRCNKCEALN